MEIVGPVLISTLHSWCPQSLSQTVKMPAIFLILYNCVWTQRHSRSVLLSWNVRWSSQIVYLMFVTSVIWLTGFVVQFSAGTASCRSFVHIYNWWPSDLVNNRAKIKSRSSFFVSRCSVFQFSHIFIYMLKLRPHCVTGACRCFYASKYNDKDF